MKASTATIRMFLFQILVTLLLASAETATASEPPRRELTAVVLKDFPPLYQTDTNGNPVGFAIDFLEQVADRSGIRIRYKKAHSWADAMQMVRRGQGDFVPGIGISPARSKEFLFTREVESVPVSCFVRDHNEQIRGIDDLDGARTAVIRQSAADTRLKKRGNISLERFETIEGALFALLAGEVDAFVFPAPVLKKKARIIGVDDQIKVVGKPLVDLKRGYLFRRTDDAIVNYLNPHIESLVKSADYRRIYLKWYGTPDPFWTARKIFIIMLVLLAGSVIGLVVWRGISLSQVNRQLAENVQKLQFSQQALKTQQTYLRTLQDNAPDAMYLSDMKGRILEVNKQSSETLGYTREELLSLTVMEVDANYPSLSTLVEVWETLPLFESVHFDGVHKRRDGSTFPVEVNVTKIELDGEPRIFGFARDISERVRMESELRQSQKMQAIGQLAGGIAHDFNNMLAGIMGYADLLMDSLPKDGTTEKHIQAIIQASERARGLVKQILTFSRRETQKMVSASLKPVVEEALKLLKASTPSSISITTELASDVPPVMLDSLKIHEAVMNLATNAVHAMGGKGELHVKLERRELTKTIAGQHSEIHPGIWSVVTVSDTGCGMSEDVLANIFEPFFTTKAVGEGTGMGLSVVYGIMRSHEGDIVVHSAPGEGTAFDLYFPSSDVAPANNHKELEHRETGGNERILLVVDEEMLVDLGTQFLKSFGYAVTSFRSSVAALDAFRAAPDDFDLLITDQTMPTLTGAELIVKMREIKPRLPAILCSGYARGVAQDELVESDISGFVTKPFRKATLGKAVRDILDARDGPQ